MIKQFEYSADEKQHTVLVELKETLDEEGDDLVTEVTVITPVKAEHQPYVKEDVLASIHGLCIRIYDDYKFNF
jgi:hypothetical protein